MTTSAAQAPQRIPVTTLEAAARLGVTREAFLRWVQRGVIKPLIRGRRGGSKPRPHQFDLADVLKLARTTPRIKPTRKVTDDDLVTTRQIHELFGVSPTTLWKRVRAGTLEVVARRALGVGKGRTNFYRLADVRRVVAEIGGADSSEKSLVSIREASALLGVKQRTLESWKTKGWITAVAAQEKHRRILRYDLEQLRAFVANHTHGKDDFATSDDTVLSTYKAAEATGISKHTIVQWLVSGLLHPVRKCSTGSYYRVGDLRRVKSEVESRITDDEYFTFAASYYSTMGDEPRGIVHAMVRAYEGTDESPEYVLSDAIAAVMAALNCGMSCCTSLNRQQRIEKLKNFNRVYAPEPQRCSTLDYSDSPADEYYSVDADANEYDSVLLRRNESEQEAWRKEQRELFWLRLSGKYRRWARDYFQRLRSCENVI